MDDKNLVLLLTALNQIATELHQANVLATIGAPAPNVELPFVDYADFDPAAIGAKGVAKDKYGWTQLEWGMRSFYRRRSGEDDEKGEAIRFSRCTSGTVQDKNQTWETLVRFRDRKAPKKLTEDQAERMQAAAQSHRQQQPAPKQSPVAVAVAPTGPAPTQPVADPFADWKAARARINGNIPHWLNLTEGDKLDDIKARTQALFEFAAIPPEAQIELAKLSDDYIATLAKAHQLQVALSAGLAILPPNTRSIEVGAAIATINNLIAAELRKRNTSAAPTVTQSGALVTPATTATQPALGQGGARSAAEMREWFGKSVKANANQRQMNDQSRNVVYIALKRACGGDTDKLHRVILALCNVASFRDATNAQIYALQAWLKPGQGTSKPMNPSASVEAEALASMEVTTA